MGYTINSNLNLGVGLKWTLKNKDNNWTQGLHIYVCEQTKLNDNL